MLHSKEITSSKVRLFAPLFSVVFATASAGCAVVIGVEAVVGSNPVSDGYMPRFAALTLLALAALFWYFGVRSDALPGSVRAREENAAWLKITMAVYTGLLLLAMLPFSWLWWIRLLLTPAALSMLYFVGASHCVPAREEWMSRVQEWSPPFAALLLTVAIIAGCLGYPWAEMPLVVLLLIDAGLSVARFQASDQAVRDVRNSVVNPLRKSTNAAMLLRFFTGTIFAALLLGMRPGFVPVAILGAFMIDRLLLQVSVIIVQHAEATA